MSCNGKKCPKCGSCNTEVETDCDFDDLQILFCYNCKYRKPTCFGGIAPTCENMRCETAFLDYTNEPCPFFDECIKQSVEVTR